MLIMEATDRSSREAIRFELPEKISEITTARFVEYQNTVALSKPKSMIDYEEADEETRKELLTKMSTADIAVDWTEWIIQFAKFWTKLPDDYIVQLREEEVLFIYKIVNSAVASFVYDADRTFVKLDNKEFKYPPAPLNPLVNEREYMKGSRIIDTFEALQFEKYWKQLGNSNWSSLPYILAVLLRREGEELPVSSIKRELFIAERAKLFEQLPLDESLNLVFFLTIQKNILKKDFDMYSILKRMGLEVPQGISYGTGLGLNSFLNELQKVNFLKRLTALRWKRHNRRSATKH